MSPIFLMIIVIVAAALVFMSPNEYEKMMQEQAKYGKDPLIREINMYNEKREEGWMPDLGTDEYVPPKGAKVYRLPPSMVVEEEKSKSLFSKEGGEALPPPEIPMDEWGKDKGSSALKSAPRTAGDIKYESGLPNEFAVPSEPKFIKRLDEQ